MTSFIIGTAAGTAAFFGTICLVDKLLPGIVPVWAKDAKNDILNSLPIVLIINGITFIMIHGYDRFFLPTIFELSSL